MRCCAELLRRHGLGVELADERLRPITESTKGVILYQEQSMQIAKTLAGFSGAKADDLRKAIGKKNRAAMAEHPGARVLNIVGASHKPWYDGWMRQMSDVELVPLAPFLR